MLLTKLLAPTSCLIALLSLTQCNQNANKETQNTAASASAQSTSMREDRLPNGGFKVKSPFTGVDVAMQTRTVQPNKPTVLSFSGGSSISIPAAAFVSAVGQPITTPVEIRFREFHTPAEIIASGIPMKVKGADGKEAWMKTAGMFEIEGFSENLPIKIAAGKTLSVNLHSEVDGEYDAWYFNPDSGNWEDIGDSKPVPAPANAEKKKNAGPEPVAAKIQPPVKPVEFDKSKPALNFDVNLDRFPALKKLRKVIWQYAGTDAAKDPVNNKWIFSTDWDEATLDETNTPNQYLLTLIDSEQEYQIPVCPSQSGADLEKAKADYAVMLTEYQANIKMLEEKTSILNEQSDFRRSLAVKGFGIHNYDILWKKPDAISFTADFDFGNAIPAGLKNLITVYLITGEGRTIAAMPHYDWDKFRISPSSDNELVAVLPGNKMATFTQSDFNAAMPDIVAAKGGTYTFKMRVTENPVESVAAVDNIVAAGREEAVRPGANNAAGFTVFPNPASDQFNIRSSTGNFGTNAYLSVINMAGVQVSRIALPANESNYQVPIDMDWSGGNYYVRVQQGSAKPQAKPLSILRR